MHYWRHTLLLVLFLAFPATADNLVQTIKQIKPSVVAIGIHNPTGSPRIQLIGTGFAVAPGNRIATNYHVIAKSLNTAQLEEYVVLSGSANKVTVHKILSRELSPQHDLALLSIEANLPAVNISQAEMLAEGANVGFTGFPITHVLGLYPATHRGTIAAHTPVAIPADNARDLHSQALRHLQQPYLVYQLDATAYPGNSGSPLYNIQTGEVIGIVNQVYIKSSREAVLSDPSGISYAIPSQFLLDLMQQR